MNEVGLVEIKRFENDRDKATRGVVFLDSHFFGFSLELPELDNEPFVSRIKDGIHTARRVYSQSRGNFWLLDDAHNRTEIILFHPGSLAKAFKGCLGLGAEIGKIKGERAIFETRFMCEQFMKSTGEYKMLSVIIT